MVRQSTWERFLKDQELKEKKRLEKEAALKKYKEDIKAYAEKRRLERELYEKQHRRLRKIIHPRKKFKQPLPELKRTEEFKLTEEEKETCRQKSMDQLVDEISGSKLVCPPGKEAKKLSERELTADLKCFRKRVRRKKPDEIVELYDKLLEADPERLCK